MGEVYRKLKKISKNVKELWRKFVQNLNEIRRKSHKIVEKFEGQIERNLRDFWRKFEKKLAKISETYKK